MKRIICFAASVVLLMTGCHKPTPAPVPEQYDRYIFFSQKVETKAGLIESAGGVDEFGVVGFMYDDDDDKLHWTDVSDTAKPNVFYNENGVVVDVETVVCDTDGYGTYSPLQGWSNTKRYAFFAYYPIEHGALLLVNLDGKEDYTAGVPAIKYTMNSDDIYASMTDVMTAEAKTDLETSDTSVLLTFSHRLSSLGVKVKNSSSGDIVLNSVSLNISSIKYQSIVIPLDGSEVTKTAFASALAAEMALAGVAETSLAANGGESELADKLIFIPQDEDLTATVTIGYTRNAVGEDPYSYEGYTETRTLPAQTTILEEGKKHLILLNFTDSTVEIKGLANTGWVDLPEVEDTFN